MMWSEQKKIFLTDNVCFVRLVQLDQSRCFDIWYKSLQCAALTLENLQMLFFLTDQFSDVLTCDTNPCIALCGLDIGENLHQCTVSSVHWDIILSLVHWVCLCFCYNFNERIILAFIRRIFKCRQKAIAFEACIMEANCSRWWRVVWALVRRKHMPSAIYRLQFNCSFDRIWALSKCTYLFELEIVFVQIYFVFVWIRNQICSTCKIYLCTCQACLLPFTVYNWTGSAVSTGSEHFQNLFVWIENNICSHIFFNCSN